MKDINAKQKRLNDIYEELERIDVFKAFDYNEIGLIQEPYDKEKIKKRNRLIDEAEEIEEDIKLFELMSKGLI